MPRRPRITCTASSPNLPTFDGRWHYHLSPGVGGLPLAPVTAIIAPTSLRCPNAIAALAMGGLLPCL